MSMSDDERTIASQMGNVLFNLAQRPGELLTAETAAVCDALRKQWDEARTTAAPVVAEGYMLVKEAANADEIVTRLYRRFKDWNERGFGPDDVTWCEVKADINALIAAHPVPGSPAEAVKWKVCGVCLGRGERDIAHGKVEDCADCGGKGTVRTPAAAEPMPADPMDWPLPCDVNVGAGTNKKGTKLGVLVMRMETLHKMAMAALPPLTPEQQKAREALLATMVETPVNEAGAPTKDRHRFEERG